MNPTGENPACNILVCGATRKGKTTSTVQRIVAANQEAAVILDPHKQSLAEGVLTHAGGNLLYERLSETHHTLGFDMLVPSSHPDLERRRAENQLRAEAFIAILVRRRDMEGMAGTPLMEEYTTAAIVLYLFQAIRKPLTILPFAFMPGTSEFASLMRDCTLPEIRHKFEQLQTLTPRALRAEVGSAVRLVNAVFRSPAFGIRGRGGFHLGAFLQNRGKLIIERGDEIGDDTMRVIMGAIVLLVIEHAKRRPKPYPRIRIYIDEATNARLVGGPELRGIAETNKSGLFWDFLVQNLDFPGGADAVLQNCLRHEWFGCPYYDLARKAAIDIVAGLPDSEASRAERIAALTNDVMTLKPGWRWVKDQLGARKEYVPLLENPWPDWPGLREAKLQEKLQWIRARPEYGASGTPPATTSSNDIPAPPSNSREDSSPAERWKRARKRRADGSSSAGDEERRA